MKSPRVAGFVVILLGSTSLGALRVEAQEMATQEAVVTPRAPADLKISMSDLLRIAKQQQQEIEALKKRLKALEANKTRTASAKDTGAEVSLVPAAAVAPLSARRGTAGRQLAQTPTPPIELPPEPDEQTPPPAPQRAPVPPVQLPPEPEPTTPGAIPGPQAVPAQPPETTPEGERPKAERPTEQLLVQQNAILLPRGTIQVEPTIDYSYFSNSSVAISGFTIFDAIVIGTIDVNRVTRDLITASITGRYGLFDRVQLDARVPAIYRRDTTLLGVGTNNAQEASVTGKHIGDVEAGLSYQPIIGQGFIPNVVLRGRFLAPTGKSPFQIPTETLPNSTQKLLSEAPTGNGFFGTGLQATAVWRSDPVVLFTGGGYTYNFARDFDTFGHIQPGGYMSAVSGANIALNDTVSVNFSLQVQHTFESSANGKKILGSSATDARFVAGASIGVLPRANLIVSATAGLTPESPNYGVTISLPFTF